MNASLFQTLVDMTNHLATVNASYLAISVTILTLIGGFAYFINLKPIKEKLDKQEEKISLIREEVEQNLSTSKAEIKKDLIEFEKKHIIDISTIISQKNENLVSELNSKIAILETNLSKQFDEFASKKDAELKVILFAEISSQLRDLEKSLTSKIEKESKIFDEKLVDLTYNLKEVEAFKYHSQGKMGGIIIPIQVLEHDVEHRPLNVIFTLKSIRDVIEKYDLPQKYADRLKVALGKIKNEEHKKLVSEIEKLIKIGNEELS